MLSFNERCTCCQREHFLAISLSTENYSEGRFPFPCGTYGYRNVPCFFYSSSQRYVKGERDIVHAGDVVFMDILFGNLLAIVAEDGHSFSVIFCELLLDGSSCADGEMTPFHRAEAPRRTSSNVDDLHITCDHNGLESNGDRRDASTCCFLFSNPLLIFVF